MGTNYRKETLKMLLSIVLRRNLGMCCRMLYSRAYHMAGAFGCLSMRLMKILE